MNAIVSITKDWGIGWQGGLLVHNKADMKRFVGFTRGSTVVMGRKTLESFPGGPLKGRRNVVISRDPSYAPKGVEVVHSPEEAKELLKDIPGNCVWLIGGETIYQALLKDCERVFTTKNDVSVPADAYFPNLDIDPDWAIEAVEPGGVTDEGVAFEYVTYRQLEPEDEEEEQK